MKHKKWRSIYIERPTDQSGCVTRISGEEGYASGCIYDAETATFRTFQDESNRIIITVWKHDEWYYDS